MDDDKQTDGRKWAVEDKQKQNRTEQDRTSQPANQPTSQPNMRQEATIASECAATEKREERKGARTNVTPIAHTQIIHHQPRKSHV
jgi:hypothetical protein